MYDPMLGYDPVLVGARPKRLHADGTITIVCRICEKPISREMYRGFSTAICAVCHGDLERGMRPEEIRARAERHDDTIRHDVYNDIGPKGFKAEGIGMRIKEAIQQVKQAAQRRRRSPLFSNKDEKTIK